MASATMEVMVCGGSRSDIWGRWFEQEKALMVSKGGQGSSMRWDGMIKLTERTSHGVWRILRDLSEGMLRESVCRFDFDLLGLCRRQLSQYLGAEKSTSYKLPDARRCCGEFGLAIYTPRPFPFQIVGTLVGVGDNKGKQRDGENVIKHNKRTIGL
jgi:hypothetical protein